MDTQQEVLKYSLENVASHRKKTDVATSAISVVNDDNDEATDPSTRITNLPHIHGQKIELLLYVYDH